MHNLKQDSQEWIDIEKKKPPNGVYVLVANYDPRPNVKMHFIEIAERLHTTWHNGYNGERIDEKSYVTHWMPLPDVPKFEEK